MTVLQSPFAPQLIQKRKDLWITAKDPSIYTLHENKEQKFKELCRKFFNRAKVCISLDAIMLQARLFATADSVSCHRGEARLTSAPPEMRVWRTGITNFSAAEALLEPLGVVRLTLADFQATSTPAYGLAEGELLRPAFAGAILLLRQELVRADQMLLTSPSLDWDDLLTAPVVISSELSIIANLPAGQVVLRARAHMSREPLRLVVRSSAD